MIRTDRARSRFALLRHPDSGLPIVAAAVVTFLVLSKQFWIPSSTFEQGLDWLTYLPLHLLSVVMLGRAASATRLSPRAALAWRLFQISEVAIALSVGTTGTLMVLGLETFSQWSPVLSALSYPPFVAAILVLPLGQRRQPGIRGSQALGVVVLGVALILGWFFAAQPLLALKTNDLRDVLPVWWSTIGDLAPLGALAILLMRGAQPVHRSAVFIVTAATLISASADLLSTQMEIAGVYGLGSPLDASWYLATFLMGIAGAYQVVIEKTDSTRVPEQSLGLLAMLRAFVYTAIVVTFAVFVRASIPLFDVPMGGFLLGAATLSGLMVVLPAVAFRDTESAVRERRAQQARFEALVSYTTDLLLIVSRDGLLSYTSPSVERALGHDVGTLRGSNLLDLLHADDVATARRQLASAERLPNDDPFRWRIRTTGGGFVTVDARIQDRRDDALIDGIIVNARDVTAQLALEERVRHSQKMEAVGRLAGGIAHDFNNVLTVISGAVGLARELPEATDAYAEEMAEIERAVERAAALTRRLLAFSRTRELQITRVDLNAVVAGMESMLRRLVAKEVELHLQLWSEPLWVDGDAGYLEQVVLNLALNARDAMPDGGSLDIRVERDDAASSARLLVCDTGMGITEDVRAHMFDPFFTTKPLGAGTGLGLASVAAIVRDLHGRIDVESEPMRGATFIVTLALRSPVTTSSPASVATLARSAGGEQILVVDDDAAIRTTLRTFLDRLGYRVRLATHGKHALESIAADGPVDLVLTDLAMPEMNGRQLVRELHARHPQLPIICMSGYAEDPSSDDDPTRGLPFVQKPFSLESLSAEIQRVLMAR